MQFVDKCKIELKAGNGGDGMIAWRREAHVEFGGPAGGDGGNGGNVYLYADHNESTLSNLRYIKYIKAEDGVNGQSENCFGANGKDKIIKVPVGTVVYDENNEVIVDMDKDQKLFLICQGGKGGKGNASFKSSSNKAPYLYERGEVGQDKHVTFELKYLADIGLVGLPNAGKSTFIKTICHVDVKVADYAFTTIHPVLGTYFYHNEKIIFCDIPGLIEGASNGKGLGHEFLRHIERCKLLLHLVSANELDNEDIIAAYETIKEELRNYKDLISQKKIITVVTKADVKNAKEQYEKLKEYLKNEPVYFISCETGFNLDEFLKIVLKEFIKLNQNNNVLETEPTLILKDNQVINLNNLKDIKNEKENYKNIDDDFLKIYHDENQIAHVFHPILAYWSNRIPHDTRDNILRFNEKMRSLKLNEVLKKHQFNQDDVVVIDNYNIEWIID